MIRNFSEQFANLINYSVPRKFMQNEIIGSDIPVQDFTLETNRLPKPPTNGFIATYCDNRE